MIDKQLIDKQQFFAICQEAKVINQGRLGPKILESADDQIIKVFWQRKKFSKSRLISHAKRFIQNSLKLQAWNIPSVKVEQWFYCSELKAEIIIYPKLPGVDWREAQIDNKLVQLAKLIADLHQRGVFFRGIHLGNCLLLNNGETALIDITDCKLYKKSLSIFKRYRNIRHLLENQDDRDCFKEFGIEKFINTYLQFAQLGKIQSSLLSTLGSGLKS